MSAAFIAGETAGRALPVVGGGSMLTAGFRLACLWRELGACPVAAGDVRSER